MQTIALPEGVATLRLYGMALEVVYEAEQSDQIELRPQPGRSYGERIFLHQPMLVRLSGRSTARLGAVPSIGRTISPTQVGVCIYVPLS